MSDEMSAQMLKVAGIISGITCPEVFTVAGNAPLFPAGFGGYYTPQTIRIRGCRPGCLP